MTTFAPALHLQNDNIHTKIKAQMIIKDPGSSITHFIGMLCAIAGLFPLILKAASYGTTVSIVSMTVLACLQIHGVRPKGRDPQGQGVAGGHCGGDARASGAGMVHRILQKDQIPLPEGARCGLCHDGLPHRVVQGTSPAGVLCGLFLPPQSEGRLRRRDDDAWH